MSDFRSMKARELLAVLRREPLNYEMARQRGSHDGARSRPPGRRSYAATVGLAEIRLCNYCEGAMTVRVLYHREPHGWWAESPDIDGWTVAGASYEEVRRLAVDGVTFALASQAEDAGKSFNEASFSGVVLEHNLSARLRSSLPRVRNAARDERSIDPNNEAVPPSEVLEMPRLSVLGVIARIRRYLPGERPSDEGTTK
jgi:predicted RNase H-like HicB family nuclease